MCVCAWRRPRRHQLNWAVGSVHCAVHQGVHQCVRAPVCTTAAINRLQSSLALSACKSGAVVVVGVSLGSGAGATTFPSSPGSGSGLISCELSPVVSSSNTVKFSLFVKSVSEMVTKTLWLFCPQRQSGTTHLSNLTTVLPRTTIIGTTVDRKHDGRQPISRRQLRIYSSNRTTKRRNFAS